MTSSFLLSVVQLNSSNQLKDNLEKCRHWIRKSAERDAELICLPEDFAFLAVKEKEKQGLSSDDLKQIVDMLCEESIRHKVHVLAGGYPVKVEGEDRFFNTSSLFSPQGEIIASYQKLHLFDAHPPGAKPILESEQMKNGNQIVVADTTLAKIGLSICYDLRFPELYREMALLGAQILTVPSAFTLTTGKDHWRILLQARAIENQCYVAAPAQWGKHSDNRHSFGSALICDPWGSVIASVGENEGIAVAEWSKNKMQQIREIVPVWNHLRTDLFPHLQKKN